MTGLPRRSRRRLHRLLDLPGQPGLRSRKGPSRLLGLLGLAAVLGACAGAPAAPSGTGTVVVTAAFYPLEFVAARVGADRVSVTSLTKPGVEPHDLELTPADVAGLGRSALVLHLKGFQPALDAAVAQQATTTALDVGPAARLESTAGSGTDAATGAPDPHFWLDTDRYAAVARLVADRLASIDPGGAAAYRANAEAFVGALSGLDGEFRTGLRSCANRTMVTSHAAFGYLARRYDLRQVSIAGLSPDQEPSARQLADLAQAVREAKATTIYTEPLVDARFAETVAASTGAKTAVLDPVEGLTSASTGSDYLAVMRANLATLRTGQGCS